MKRFNYVFLALISILLLFGCSNNSVGNDETEVTTNIVASEDSEGGKTLVAYFSATGNTKNVAEKISEVIDCDTFEIIPTQPYTDDDLNYNEDNSRTSIEMNDKDSRPEISNRVENMADYDVVFIGYPIWWGEAPRIINTFVESYDLENKTIIPFCTSGGSGIGDSSKNLEMLSPANWLEGKRFSGNASSEDIKSWLEDLK